MRNTHHPAVLFATVAARPVVVRRILADVQLIFGDLKVTYLNWLLENTPTTWWHDSADVAELDLALSRGASGVTTNPFLSALALQSSRGHWSSDIDAVLARNLPAAEKAEALMRIAVTHAAGKSSGYVCAQVNPLRAGDREVKVAIHTGAGVAAGAEGECGVKVADHTGATSGRPQTVKVTVRSG